MYERSFVGETRAVDLISRINAEGRVGESLSSDTIHRYTRTVRQIATRASEGDEGKLTPEMVVRDFVERVGSKSINQASARLERAAALFWIAEKAQLLMDVGSSDFGRYEAAYRDLLNTTTSSLPRSSKRSSGDKLKAFPDEAVEILELAALTNRSEVLLNTLLFVRTNLLLGLRPIEWFEARLVSYVHRDSFGHYRTDQNERLRSSIALEVDNAKTSPVRGNGETRTILLDKLTRSAKFDLDSCLKMIQEMRQRALKSSSRATVERQVFRPIQDAIRRTLLNAGWQGQIPTIYSTRHQAVANAKADGHSQKEIAALFGHSSTQTARRHYGKKFNGYTGRSARPTPESILGVRTGVAAPYGADWLIEDAPTNAQRAVD